MPNTELLTKVLHHIEDHPAEWAQDSWGVKSACGTAHCFGGHASVTFAGDAPVWVAVDPGDEDEGASFYEVIVDGDNENPVLVADRARKLLGLSRTEADTLFAQYNTLETLRALVLELVETGGLANTFTLPPQSTAALLSLTQSFSRLVGGVL